MTLEYGDPRHLTNLSALLRLLRATEASIRALKKTLRTTWTRPMHDEQRTLLSHKRQATLLCALRAATRGRQHVVTRPRSFGPYQVWDARSHNLALARAALDRFDLGAGAENDVSPQRVAR